MPTLRSSAWFSDESEDVPVDRLTLRVVDGTGRATAVELLVRPDSVELWHEHHLAAVFDRALLHRWLTAPDQVLTRADVALGVDRTVDVRGRTAITDVHGRVTVSVAEVAAWPLFPSELERLQRLI